MDIQRKINHILGKHAEFLETLNELGMKTGNHVKILAPFRYSKKRRVVVLYTEGSKKMYSLFDSQYLWNKVTCSYNSCVERE
jgi:hypothetical protein